MKISVELLRAIQEFIRHSPEQLMLTFSSYAWMHSDFLNRIPSLWLTQCLHQVSPYNIWKQNDSQAQAFDTHGGKLPTNHQGAKIAVGAT